MLWCESVAPFGKPVVPEVYWMLIGSSNWSDASRAASSASPIARAAGEQRGPVLLEHDRRAAAARATSSSIAT